MIAVALIAAVWGVALWTLARTHPEALSAEARVAGLFVCMVAILALTVVVVLGAILGW